MRFFSVRLILALFVSSTLVSVGSTYFEVLAHKHTLRRELEQRTVWLGKTLQPDLEYVVANGQIADMSSQLAELRSTDEALGLAVYNANGEALAVAGPSDVFKELSQSVLVKAMRKGAEVAAFGHDPDHEWLEEAIPLNSSNKQIGVLVILEDAGYIRSEGAAVWRRSLWRILALTVLIVAVTLLAVRWFLMDPMTRMVERLRSVRLGEEDLETNRRKPASNLYQPLAREVETMAESLAKARASAAAEARLREEGEHIGQRSAWQCMCATGTDQARFLSSRTGSPTCMCARAGRRFASCLRAVWSRPLSRCCAPATEFGLRMAAETPMFLWSTHSIGCACRPTIRATLCAGSGFRAKRRAVITTALPTKDCGRCAISPIRGRSFAQRIGSSYKRVNEKFAACAA